MANLPLVLERRLVAYRRKLARRDIFLCVSTGLLCLVASFFLLFFSDRAWDTPGVVRLVLLSAGISGLAAALYRLVGRWLFMSRGISWVAVEVQRGRRELGDRLLGAVELAQSESADDGSISEELKEAAIRKVTEQAIGMDFCNDIPMRRALAVCCAMLALVVVCAGLFGLFPDAALNSALRWSRPLGSLGRYTFVVLSGHEEPFYVARGEPAELVVALDGRSAWFPQVLRYWIPGGDAGVADFADGEARVMLESVHEDSDIRVRAGDALGTLHVRPVHRPALLSLDAEIGYPVYTGRGKISSKLDSNALKLLRGASYSLEGVVSRELRSAAKVEDGSPSSLEVSGAKFAVPEVKVTEDAKISLDWLDALGFSPATSYDLRIDIFDDSEPFTECAGLSPFSAVLVDEALTLPVVAEDDFGVMRVGVEFYVDGVAPGNKRGQPRAFELARGERDDRRLESEFVFAADMLDIPENSLVVLRSFASDYYPGRGVVHSVPYRIYVLSHEQHLRLLEDRLEKVAARLEDLVRREENSLHVNESIAEMPDDEISLSETHEKLKSQSARERAEKNELMRLSKEIMETLRESLRNKKFPDSTAAEWSELAEKLKELHQNDMEKLTAALDKAAGSMDPASRREGVEDAVESQKELVEKLSKLIEDSSKSLESLAVENFVTRLRKESEREKAITSALGEMLHSVIGLPPAEIQGENRVRLDELLSEQKTTGRNAGYIQDDLSGYFARTRIEAYKSVLDSMEEKNMRHDLEELEDSISENFTTRSIEKSKVMGDNFAIWAEMLSKSDMAKSQEPGDGEPQEMDTEFLMGLLRLIQKEQNLREKTRMLDQRKPDSPEAYKAKALELAYEQGDIHLHLSFLEDMARGFPPVFKLLDAAGEVMDEVVAFLRAPATDAPVIAAQTQIIEMLSGAFQESSSQSSASPMSMLAALMQMLQPGAGASGGSMAGGTTDALNRIFNDPAFGREDPAGSPDKVHGSGALAIPEEYREAIEAYFRKLSLIED